MKSQPKGKQESGLIFVGGPALTDRTGPVRSRLLQQAHRQKKSQQRQNAATERELLQKGQRSGTCTCYKGASVLVMPTAGTSHDTQYRPIMPKSLAAHDIGRGQLCSFCGKPPTSPNQLPPVQVWDIGAGGSDPMIPVDNITSQLKMQEILHYACTSIWPNFRPLAYTSNCYQSWVFPWDNKVRLYAVLWSASYHRDILNISYGGPAYQAGSKEQLILKGLALESLRNEVSTYTSATPIDSIIMCILYLAVNDTVGITRLNRDPCPFNPPFTYLHALDLYGSRDYHPAHWNIIHDLLGRYGGIEVLKDFGLSWLISLSDIMSAAHTLQSPIYPCMGINGDRLFLEPPLKLFEHFAPHFSLETTGFGFHELLYIDPPVRQEIVATFTQIGQLSCVLQFYTKKPYSLEVLDLLGDTRNYVHHSLFSSPDPNSPAENIFYYSDREPEDIELSREVYGTCRLALYLYATHVTFPIPRSNKVRSQLLQLLCPKIELLVQKRITRRLLLWCVSVALIAVDIDPDDAMHTLFRQLCCEVEITKLDDLLVLLRKFAWVDQAVKHQYQRLSTIVINVHDKRVKQTSEQNTFLQLSK